MTYAKTASNGNYCEIGVHGKYINISVEIYINKAFLYHPKHVDAT